MHFRLIRWDIDALKRGAAAVKIYGLFHDAKEVHYVVSIARHANTAREAYETNVLQCEGFSPAAVPEELKTLRVECCCRSSNMVRTTMLSFRTRLR